MALYPRQLESALVIALRESINWESAQPVEPPVVNPALPVDPTVYQLRDRALAYRDLIVGAAVVEVALQVSNVYNYQASAPALQGPVYPALSFYGSNTGQLNSQVRHVLNASIPWDAARYADCDLYGRDALAYEVLARACQQAFLASPLPRLDATGTVIPNTSAWSLASGAAARADINPSLPLNQNLFKSPDQNLADRDNQMAGYVAQLAQRLKNPFAYALRLYVQVLSGGQLQREPEIYALVSDDGVNRVFQAEPALANANQIVYNDANKTLQWMSENVDEVHVPQIYALAIPGLELNQTLQTLAVVPAAQDCQFWRSKAGQIQPNGQSVTDVACIPYTYAGSVTGGQLQIPCASLTAPGALAIHLPAVSTGTNRVSVLVNPCSVVEISGGENTSLTNGVNGGVDWAVNVPSGSLGPNSYIVVGGDGIVYNGSTCLPGVIFAGVTGVTTYTQAGPALSSVRQYAVTWNLALPVGTWSLQIEYADLTGLNSGLGVRADYTVAGASPVTIAKDIVPLLPGGPAGSLQVTPPNYFNITSAQPFTLSVYWTYGAGQLHVQRLLFSTNEPNGIDYNLSGTLGSATALASFTAQQNQAEVVRFDFPPGTSTLFHLSSAEIDLPLRVEAVAVQAVGTFTPTPLTASFQNWRQECLDRAERVVQQGYNQTLAAYANAGSVIPSFRDSGSRWSVAAHEQWMSFVEVSNPRLRQIAAVYDLLPGRQYQATQTTVYNGTSYPTGSKFYGVSGVTTASQTVTQVGAFVRSTPGHVGRPCLAPKGLYFNDAVYNTGFTNAYSGTYSGTFSGTDSISFSGTSSGTGVITAYWDTPYSVPTIVTCQPWMVECGVYSAQSDFWLPEMLGSPLALTANL